MKVEKFPTGCVVLQEVRETWWHQWLGLGDHWPSAQKGSERRGRKRQPKGQKVGSVFRWAWAPSGLRGGKNRPTPFLGPISWRVNKPGSVCPLSYHRFLVCCLSFIRATFRVPLVCVCMCSVSWLFWLNCQ